MLQLSVGVVDMTLSSRWEEEAHPSYPSPLILRLTKRSSHLSPDLCLSMYAYDWICLSLLHRKGEFERMRIAQLSLSQAEEQSFLLSLFFFFWEGNRSSYESWSRGTTDQKKCLEFHLFPPFSLLSSVDLSFRSPTSSSSKTYIFLHTSSILFIERLCLLGRYLLPQVCDASSLKPIRIQGLLLETLDVLLFSHACKSEK